MEKFARWMTKTGVDDAKVAEQVGCSRVQISRIRRGKAKPSAALAMRLSALTNIRWHEFISPPERRARRKKADAA